MNSASVRDPEVTQRHEYALKGRCDSRNTEIGVQPGNLGQDGCSAVVANHDLHRIVGHSAQDVGDRLGSDFRVL